MKMPDDYEEILALVRRAKADLYDQLDDGPAARQERVKAAHTYLNGAMGAASEGRYKDALRMLKQLTAVLEEAQLLPEEWAEIYVAQAICHARLGQTRQKDAAWKRAKDLEPDNEVLRQIAVRRGLIKG
jgi:tetratricopeptide (TPR) repeat protein